MTTERGASGLSRGEIIERAVSVRLARTHVAFPASIVEIQSAPARKRVSVRPAVDFVVIGADGRPTYERAPVIHGVPLAFPRSPRAGVTFPVEVGDPVLVVVSDRPLGDWLRSATATEATATADVGSHCLDGAVAIPGLLPDAAEPFEVDHPVFGFFGPMGTAVHVRETDVRIGGDTGTQPIALAPGIEAVFDAFANATPVVNDGGAAIQAAFKAAWDLISNTVSATKARAL